jgi:hypothetical protein
MSSPGSNKPVGIFHNLRAAAIDKVKVGSEKKKKENVLLSTTNQNQVPHPSKLQH